MKFIELNLIDSVKKTTTKISVNCSQIAYFKESKEGTVIYFCTTIKENFLKSIEVTETYETVVACLSST